MPAKSPPCQPIGFVGSAASPARDISPLSFAGSPLAPLARLELARAAADAGDMAASRRAYQELLAQWSDADPDLPVVEQAKAEYARLDPP